MSIFLRKTIIMSEILLKTLISHKLEFNNYFRWRVKWKTWI